MYNLWGLSKKNDLVYLHSVHVDQNKNMRFDDAQF
jgi:hypothetical protein